MLQVHLLRRVKRQTLVLIMTYVEGAQEAQHVPQLLQVGLPPVPGCAIVQRLAVVQVGARCVAATCSVSSWCKLGLVVWLLCVVARVKQAAQRCSCLGRGTGCAGRLSSLLA